MKVITCPHCGQPVAVNGLGRKPFNMPVIKVYDAIRLCHSIPAAANELGCSRAYIYKVLKGNGMTLTEVLKGEVTNNGISQRRLTA